MRIYRIALREASSYSFRSLLSENGGFFHLQALKLRLSFQRAPASRRTGTTCLRAHRLRCASAFGAKPGFAAGLRHLAHPQDIALPLGNPDHSARVGEIAQLGGFVGC